MGLSPSNNNKHVGSHTLVIFPFFRLRNMHIFSFLLFSLHPFDLEKVEGKCPFILQALPPTSNEIVQKYKETDIGSQKSSNCLKVSLLVTRRDSTQDLHVSTIILFLLLGENFKSIKFLSQTFTCILFSLYFPVNYYSCKYNFQNYYSSRRLVLEQPPLLVILHL